MKIRALKAVFAVAAAATLLWIPTGAVHAEEVKVPVKTQVQRSLQEDLPRNGLSEASVRNRWGQPRSVTGPVGDPPIAQWHYENFTVYFEGNRVIHSVLRHNR